MKYKIILDALIQRATLRGKMEGVYQERHHIIPVCSKATAQTCISKFQKGWIPKEDPAWLKFYGDNNG